MTKQTNLTMQNRIIICIAIVFRLLVSHVHTLSYSSSSFGYPSWDFFTTTPYFSYVSDGSPVTSITVNQAPLSFGSYLYGLVANGLSGTPNSDGGTNRPCPNDSTGFIFKQTVTLTASQSITSMIAWSYKLDTYRFFLTQISFVLSDGTTYTVTSAAFSSATDIKHTYTTPAG